MSLITIIEIILINGQIIFLDPSYSFGINIGGIRQKERWKINSEIKSPITEQCIKISKDWVDYWMMHCNQRENYYVNIKLWEDNMLVKEIKLYEQWIWNKLC